MILFKIYNDDKIRKWNFFPTLKDPMVLENTLLRILNKLFLALGLPTEREFDIYNPRFSNLHLTYYTISNLHSWGELPLSYIYNDMVRLIQSRNSSNNFIMTVESIEISKDISHVKDYYSIYESTNDISGEIVSAYILENYMISYGYIKNHNNGILTIRIPYEDRYLYYIISVGFNYMENSIWFSNGFAECLSNIRYKSLCGIVKIKCDYYKIPYPNISLESSDGKSRSTIDSCRKFISGYELDKLKRKSLYDTEIKYGNYPIDYNWLNQIDNALPVGMFIYEEKNSKSLVNRFNQPDYTRVDYRLLKKENELIEIDKKKPKSFRDSV